ncbi:SHOCT domain-containing protein [Arthrobacter sp. MYb213]|uniref:SHOCT domain-containing protein n=1 Tax=Arthrobacter sp. MYb213 TaxID=1848595 RepID=UPI000CFB6839|nr:SHOCT domain-containing protein [Arthrobacter sp. MYb213]PRB71337.1 hypothetical protein CQ011_05390 [Arthrobacter sp. MYb213]
MQIGHGIKDKHVAKVLVTVHPYLSDGEEVRAIVKGGTKFFSELIVLTSVKIIEIDAGGEATSKLGYSEFDPEDFLIKKSDSKLVTKLLSGTVLKWSFNAFKGSTEDRDLFLSIVDPIARAQDNTFMQTNIVPGDPYPQAPDSPKVGTPVVAGTHYLTARDLPDDLWAGILLPLGKPRKKATNAILRMGHNGERPWMVLVSFTAGLIAAFDDRLVVIKTGAWNSFGAGSFGGERSATIYYSDITGIEYNSGLMMGVLEILTPSYSGSANKDYWKGSTSSFNADANNPFTLSNTLPLDKSDYNKALPEINELRRRIAESKKVIVHMPAPVPVTQEPSLGTRLRELKDLHSEGILTDQEFSVAKEKLLG